MVLSGDDRVHGFTMGVFDCAHAGHIYLISKAFEHCDFLNIALMDDDWTEKNKGKRPLFTFKERLKTMKEITEQLWGDKCFVLEEPSSSLDVTDLLIKTEAEVFVHGSDWLLINIAEMIPKRMSQMMLEAKVDCILVPYFEPMSTTRIRMAAEKRSVLINEF
jgi:cytidyltransferase-like protein